MRNKIFLTIILFIISYSFAFALTGRQIMEKTDALPEAKSGKSLVYMNIYRNGQLREKKVFKIAQKKFGDVSKGLTQFIKPTKIKFLMHENKNRDDDQWLTTSRGKPKRIASQDKGKPFVHSHFSYQNLENRDIDDYEYKLLGNSNALGQACYKVEAKRIKGKKIYSKNVLYVRKSDFFVVKVEFYKDGEILKTLENYDIKKVDGILTPFKVIMKLNNGKGKTEMIVKEVKYNVKILNSLLNKGTL